MSATARRNSPNSPVRERPRIVIADDHEPTRVLLRTLIELEAMHVVGEAENGKTAIALALEHDPDIVLLDINMPGLDGISAAGIIRAQHPRIHILLHTGEPLETTRDRAAALHLPLADKRDLHKTIEQLAAVRQPQRSEFVGCPAGGPGGGRFWPGHSHQERGEHVGRIQRGGLCLVPRIAVRARRPETGSRDSPLVRAVKLGAGGR